MNGLTIVLPARNEAHLIDQVVFELAEHLSEQKINCEILVVDDASTDQTPDILRNLKTKLENIYPESFLHFNYLCSPKRVGCHKAFLLGALTARFSFVIFMPGDGQSPPETAVILYKKMLSSEVKTLAICGERVQRQDFFHRKWLAGFYNTFLKIFCKVDLKDADGPAIFQREALQIAARRTISCSTFLAAELYMELQNIGGSISSVKVPHRARKSGKSRYSICPEGTAMIMDYIKKVVHTSSDKTLPFLYTIYHCSNKNGFSNEEIALKIARDYFRGNIGLVAVRSKSFCNRHLRMEDAALYLTGNNWAVEIASREDNGLPDYGYWAKRIASVFTDLDTSIVTASISSIYADWPGHWNIQLTLDELHDKTADQKQTYISDDYPPLPALRRQTIEADAWMACSWLDTKPALTLKTASVLYRESGRPDIGLSLIQMALKFDPDNLSFWYEKGLCLLEYRKLSTQYYQLYENSNEIADNSEECNSAKKMLQDARKSFLQVVEKDMHNAAAYCDLGRVNNDLELYEEAIKAYKKAIEAHQQNKSKCPAFLFRDLANTFMELKDFTQAIKHLQKALQIDPNDQWSRQMLNNLLTQHADNSHIV